MKHILKIILLVFIVVCGTGCTTGYWADRGRDAADVFTMTLGVGVGLKARIGPAECGLLLASDQFGLRGGKYHPSGIVGDTSCMIRCDEIQMLLLGGDDFGCSCMKYDQRDKRHSSFYMLLIPCSDSIMGSPPTYNASYWTQVEAVVALGPSVRLGFNPGELLDLILGFIGVDIYNDDLERRKKQEIEQKNSG